MLVKRASQSLYRDLILHYRLMRLAQVQKYTGASAEDLLISHQRCLRLPIYSRRYFRRTIFLLTVV